MLLSLSRYAAFVVANEKPINSRTDAAEQLKGARRANETENPLLLGGRGVCPIGHNTGSGRMPPMMRNTVRWRTPLEETGQSGVLYSKGRLYFQSMAPLKDASAPKDAGNTVGWCADARTGRLLWSVPLSADEPAPYSYGFSDSSSPTPVTDGKQVWFVNSSGRVTCCDTNGKPLWTRTWKPTTGRPFNKQFEPILYKNTLINLEPRDPADPKREKDAWNYLVGLDAATGKLLWTSTDGLTHYCTPTLGTLGREPVVLIGRGGHHDVPEKPTGLSLIRATDGSTVWRTELPGKALYNLRFDNRYAYWLNEDEGTHTVVDVRSGKLLRTQSLGAKADVRCWSNNRYVLERDANIKGLGFRVFPAWFSNTTSNGWHWFLCFSQTGNDYGVGPCGPMHCVGRVHIETGKVEYLELPTEGIPRLSPVSGWDRGYNTAVSASTINSRGIEAASDPRSKRDGWFWNFNAPPVEIKGHLYWTLMNGMTYTLKANAPVLDESALLEVACLGTVGDTWCLSQPAWDGRYRYYRTLKELVCVE
ncbi:MAG: PQQ-binding-like beta-propeller repeat protein [Armatimonas sp.]